MLTGSCPGAMPGLCSGAPSADTTWWHTGHVLTLGLQCKLHSLRAAAARELNVSALAYIPLSCAGEPG